MEKIKIKIRKTAILIIYKFFLLTTIFNLLYMIISLVADNYEKFNNEWAIIAYDSISLLVLIIIQLLILLFRMISRFKESYTIENWTITHKEWIFSKKEQIYNIEKIRSIQINKTFWWNIMEYWNIKINYNIEKIIIQKDQNMQEQKENDSNKIILSNVPNPEQLIFLIDQQNNLS